jgi:hypothetical protein
MQAVWLISSSLIQITPARGSTYARTIVCRYLILPCQETKPSPRALPACMVLNCSCTSSQRVLTNASYTLLEYYYSVSLCPTLPLSLINESNLCFPGPAPDHPPAETSHWIRFSPSGICTSSTCHIPLTAGVAANVATGHEAFSTITSTPPLLRRLLIYLCLQQPNSASFHQTLHSAFGRTPSCLASWTT